MDLTMRVAKTNLARKDIIMPRKTGNWRSFEEARTHIQSLNLKGQKEWRVFVKTASRPEDIPSSPDVTYKDQWVSWPDWLGKAPRPFEEARAFARTLGFKNKAEWQAIAKSPDFPRDIPYDPSRAYEEWKDWQDWLGFEWRSFKEARTFTRTLNLGGQKDWIEFTKSGNLPKDIPASPSAFYGNGQQANRKHKGQWISWPDWVGTNK